MNSVSIGGKIQKMVQTQTHNKIIGSALVLNSKEEVKSKRNYRLNTHLQ